MNKPKIISAAEGFSLAGIGKTHEEAYRLIGQLKTGQSLVLPVPSVYSSAEKYLNALSSAMIRDNISAPARTRFRRMVSADKTSIIIVCLEDQ